MGGNLKGTIIYCLNYMITCVIILTTILNVLQCSTMSKMGGLIEGGLPVGGGLNKETTVY